MNISAKLLIVFQEVPSDEQKQSVREDVESFLLNIDPQIHPEINTGEGSWWIDAFFWTSNIFMEWLAEKGLDRIFCPSKEQTSSVKMIGLVEPEVFECSSGKQNIELKSDYQIKKTSSYASLYDEMNEIMSRMDDIKGGNKKIILGIYNSSNDCGRIATLTNRDGDITLSIIQTDSKDDYNKLTNY
jgi:hypothetical protein